MTTRRRCPSSPSGNHRWAEAGGRDFSARVCVRCGAAGVLDKQGLVRFVDSGKPTDVE